MHSTLRRNPGRHPHHQKGAVYGIIPVSPTGLNSFLFDLLIPIKSLNCKSFMSDFAAAAIEADGKQTVVDVTDTDESASTSSLN